MQTLNYSFFKILLIFLISFGLSFDLPYLYLDFPNISYLLIINRSIHDKGH